MAVARDPLSFRDKPSEQPVVAFIGSPLKGGVRVSEVDLRITDLNGCKFGKLGTVVGRNSLEDSGESITEIFPEPL